MAGYRQTPYSDAFSRQFGVMWGISIVAHVVFLGIFALVAPGATPSPAEEKPEVLMFDLEDLSDLPKGSGVGPVAPTKSVSAAVNPFEKDPVQTKEKQTKADMPENVKPREKANSKRRSGKTRQAVVEDKMRNSAIERLKAMKEQQQVGGGGEGQGDGGSVMKLYVARVRQKIRSKWKLPSGLSAADRDRSASVVVRIDGQGNLIGYSIAKSSGMASMDATIQNAIKNAAPFSVPPKEAVDKVAKGIGFTFKAKEAQ